MDTFSASLSSKEIVCVVQQIVTTDYYDNYELAVFRSTYASGGDCDDIADHDWALVTHNKQRLDYVNSMITMELDLCNRWLFCECWPNLLVIVWFCCDIRVKNRIMNYCNNEEMIMMINISAMHYKSCIHSDYKYAIIWILFILVIIIIIAIIYCNKIRILILIINNDNENINHNVSTLMRSFRTKYIFT